MPMMLDDENDGAKWYSIADIVSYLAVVSGGMPSFTTSQHRNLHPVEIALRLLRDVAIFHGYNGNDDDDEICEDREEATEQQADVLVHRIRTNDPKLTTLALRNSKVWDRGQPVSSFCGFTQSSIQQATDALHTNHTIRSVSCRYDWRYPRRILHRLRNDDEEYSDGSASDEHYNNSSLRATPYNRVTKLQERRFFEACVCLPHLESISLTGGNRWRISHLITILETAKGLKKLTVRDVLIKSSSELNALKRLLLGSTRRTYAPILLEAIELTIEDQTNRNDKYWSTAATIDNDESPFDRLLESLIASPNIKQIKLSKSILSRFHLRPVHDVSTQTLLKLAKCQSLSKLVISGISLERGGIEAMCESLIQKNGHLTHFELYGCAFNHTVGQSGWNALFRLIDHDSTIQIRASSLVYLQRRRRRSESGDTEPHDIPEEEELGLSAFVRRPREDFSFSLRDKDGANKHFQNRDLDIQYMLQEAGFFRLLRTKEEARSSDWINIMAVVRDDSIALFCILRENPALCDILESTRQAPSRSGNLKNGREKKRRKIIPAIDNITLAEKHRSSRGACRWECPFPTILF